MKRVAGCLGRSPRSWFLAHQTPAFPRARGEDTLSAPLGAAKGWTGSGLSKLPFLSPHPWLHNDVIAFFPLGIQLQEQERQVSALLIRCLHQPKHSWST